MFRKLPPCVAVSFCIVVASACATFAVIAAPPASRPQAPESVKVGHPHVLVFSKTAGYRHDSIPDGIKAITAQGKANGFDVDATEDAALFDEEHLSRYRVVIFLNTTGDVLDDKQQDAFENFIHRGGGFVGVHAATDTEYDWKWYTKLVGAQFASHPKIQEATIDVTDRSHASTKSLPAKWKRTDEWYNFKTHPSDSAGGSVRILASVDESTYEGGSMNAEHPVIWCQEFDGGRAWYTALGHTRESYEEPNFLRMLLGGIQWAGGFQEKPD